mmetsp:Transcript_34650/g.61936  ORF Transcript_34650/g.61936 Transcript_34650/m.61936 type:complete len:312 (-) Transcript_34650:1518-2453(-)
MRSLLSRHAQLDMAIILHPELKQLHLTIMSCTVGLGNVSYRLSVLRLPRLGLVCSGLSQNRTTQLRLQPLVIFCWIVLLHLPELLGLLQKVRFLLGRQLLAVVVLEPVLVLDDFDVAFQALEDLTEGCILLGKPLGIGDLSLLPLSLAKGLKVEILLPEVPRLGLLVHHPVEQPLLCGLPLVDCLLGGVMRDQPVDVALLRLPIPPGPGDGLRVIGGVPGYVVQDDAVGRHQVDTGTPRLDTDEEHLALLLKVFDRPLSVVLPHLPVDPLTVNRPTVQCLLNEVQGLGKLTEDQRLILHSDGFLDDLFEAH